MITNVRLAGARLTGWHPRLPPAGLLGTTQPADEAVGGPGLRSAW
jgi:hypothetical protein